MENNLKKPVELLAQTIQKRRKEQHLTQQQLADIAGCGVVFIHLVESGKISLRLDKLLAVMQVLGLQFHLEGGKKIIISDFISNSEQSEREGKAPVALPLEGATRAPKIN